jgi:hypothetical protein
MFKPIQAFAGQASRPQAPVDEDIINRLFQFLHGQYGNLFMNKFSTGERGAAGEDAGMANAKQVWGAALRKFSPEAIRGALRQAQSAHPEYPPSLPQFVALCAANTPRQAYQPSVPALEMGQPLRSQYARRTREIVAKHAQRAQDRIAGRIPEVTTGLDGLKQAIAQAAADSGLDEAQTLHDLDVLLSPKDVP